MKKFIWLFAVLAAGSLPLLLSSSADAGADPFRAKLVGLVLGQTGCDIRLTLETDLETKTKVVTDKGKVSADFNNANDIHGTVEWVGCPLEQIEGKLSIQKSHPDGGRKGTGRNGLNEPVLFLSTANADSAPTPESVPQAFPDGPLNMTWRGQADCPTDSSLRVERGDQSVEVVNNNDPDGDYDLQIEPGVDHGDRVVATGGINTGCTGRLNWELDIENVNDADGFVRGTVQISGIIP